MKRAFSFAFFLLIAAFTQAFAEESTASSNNTGTFTRDGKTIPVTAVYAAKENNQYNVVFSDSTSATARAKNAAYASVGDIATDAIARELTKQGAHPFTLKLLGKGEDTSIIVEWGSAVNAPMSGLDDSRQKLRIGREDDQRLEGVLDYVDSELELQVPFALDLGKFGHATEAAEPPPPPPRPQPVGPSQNLAVATARLQYELREYYKSHHKSWPTSIDEPGFGDSYLTESMNQLPAMIETVTLDAGGVISATFRSEAPKLGGKSVKFTPVISKDGDVEWKCAGKGVAKDDLPNSCR